MMPCTYCGSPTQLYIRGTPVCIQCEWREPVHANVAPIAPGAANTSSKGLYRTTAPIVALLLQLDSGTLVGQTIPEGSTVTILDPTTLAAAPEAGLNLVEARWEGKSVLLFGRDVRDRAQRVTEEPG
jgi:hypothetical protein